MCCAADKATAGAYEDSRDYISDLKLVVCQMPSLPRVLLNCPADKATAGAYEDPREFISDLKLVVSNAKTFNVNPTHFGEPASQPVGGGCMCGPGVPALSGPAMPATGPHTSA